MTSWHDKRCERPRLHIIEDLQWADVASVLLLAHLGAAIVDAPLLVVATMRTGEPRSPQLDDAIEEVRRTVVVRDLPALDHDDIAALIRGAGVEPDEHLVDLDQGADGREPALRQRVAPRHASVRLRRAAARMVAENVPARVSDLVLHRLGRLPAPVADALVTASVIGCRG